MKEINIKFKLNGKEVETKVGESTLLLELLREKLHVTSVKYGCGIGECGACTVLIDGEPYLSCLVLAAEVDGKEVRTAESVDNSFIDHLERYSAVQCGYCTPGFVVMSEYLPKYLKESNEEEMGEEELKEYFSGNVCRCTGYFNIIKAAKAYVNDLKSKK
mgnify:FL=1